MTGEPDAFVPMFQSGERLDLRGLFAQPWEGEGTVWRPWWTRFAPAPASFVFRSEIENVNGDRWDIVDTTTLPDGTVQRRRMRAHQLRSGRIRLTAEDMPGGAEVHPRSDGFTFSPYVIRTPILGVLRVALRYHDTVRLLDGGATMLDLIELRLGRILVARIEIRLRRAGR